LVEGSRVPAFQALDDSGRSVSAASLAGTPFVLYFYPKDNTPGCTREACGFRDDRAAFDALGVRIFGVSPDSVKSHQGFISKQQLNFSLLSDPDKALAQAFSVYKLKKLYGKESLGIERSTFLVGADGRVLRVWRGVRVDGHVEAVLEAARALVAA
jgi:peroxiredoxin Q/BCP